MSVYYDCLAPWHPFQCERRWLALLSKQRWEPCSIITLEVFTFPITPLWWHSFPFKGIWIRYSRTPPGFVRVGGERTLCCLIGSSIAPKYAPEKSINIPIVAPLEHPNRTDLRVMIPIWTIPRDANCFEIWTASPTTSSTFEVTISISVWSLICYLETRAIGEKETTTDEHTRRKNDAQMPISIPGTGTTSYWIGGSM